VGECIAARWKNERRAVLESIDEKERRAKRPAAGTALAIAFQALLMVLMAVIFLRYVA
jgi:hypothetical protein